MVFELAKPKLSYSMSSNAIDRLRIFLNDSRNSQTRERMFFNRLYFDLKLAAAIRGYALSIFEPEVDREGYDIVVDDHDTERRFQLKTFTSSSGTSEWAVTKRFLLPPIPDNTVLGFETSPEGVGLGGGIIVTKIDDSGLDCSVSYLYTDLYLINALQSGLVQSKQSVRRTRILKWCREFYTALHKTKHHGKVKLRKSLFVEVKSADALLAIAGFHCAIGARSPGCYRWWDHYLDALKLHFQIGSDGYPIEEKEAAAQAHVAAQMLLSVIGTKQFDPFASRRPIGTV